MLNPRMFVSVAVLVMAASTVSAQGRSWGPVVGLTQTTLTNVVTAEYRTGFTAGAQFRSESRDATTFWTLGLAYSERGATVPNVGASGKMVLSYVEVPLFTAWNISIENPWITPYVTVGAQLGVRLSCIITGGAPTKSLNCDDPVFGSVNLASYDLVLGGGGGMNFTWRDRKFFVDGRYLFGNRAIMADTRSKNRGFTLAFGYIMPLHRAE